MKKLFLLSTLFFASNGLTAYQFTANQIKTLTKHFAEQQEFFVTYFADLPGNPESDEDEQRAELWFALRPFCEQSIEQFLTDSIATKLFFDFIDRVKKHEIGKAFIRNPKNAELKAKLRRAVESMFEDFLKPLIENPNISDDEKARHIQNFIQYNVALNFNDEMLLTK